QAQDWSKYRNFNNSNDNLVNNSRYAGGIEFVPDMNSIDNYFLRAIYRAGFSYATTQYLVGNAPVNEIGINFGVSLPVSRTSLVNLAVQAGNRGNNTDLAIKENYLRISLGFTYNDKWFIRRRID
ncbi:MAG TPA: hypothetical protein VI583_14360, partial [Cyclobacteriaceae bacterium]|nr:hypothetical protein [Cyclobacteriaceae bacterium]